MDPLSEVEKVGLFYLSIYFAKKAFCFLASLETSIKISNKIIKKVLIYNGWWDYYL